MRAAPAAAYMPSLGAEMPIWMRRTRWQQQLQQKPHSQRHPRGPQALGKSHPSSQRCPYSLAGSCSHPATSCCSSRQGQAAASGPLPAASRQQPDLSCRSCSLPTPRPTFPDSPVPKRRSSEGSLGCPASLRSPTPSSGLAGSSLCCSHFAAVQLAGPGSPTLPDLHLRPRQGSCRRQNGTQAWDPLDTAGIAAPPYSFTVC